MAVKEVMSATSRRAGPAGRTAGLKPAVRPGQGFPDKQLNGPHGWGTACLDSGSYQKKFRRFLFTRHLLNRAW